MMSDYIWDLLYPATEGFEGVESAAVTCDFGESLRIGLAGGNLDELKELEKEICSFAKEQNYRFVEIIGRPGWERELTDYKRTAVLLRKELGYGLH